MKSSVFTKRCFERSVKIFKIGARHLERPYIGNKKNDTISLIGVFLWILGSPYNFGVYATEQRSCEYEGFLIMLAKCNGQSFSFSLRCNFFDGSFFSFLYVFLSSTKASIFYGNQIYPSLRSLDLYHPEL